jgi:hypothetical protein
VALFAEEQTATIDDAQVILLWLILVSRKLGLRITANPAERLAHNLR